MDLPIWDVNCIFGFWPRRRIDASLEKLFSAMGRHGIEKAFVANTRGIFSDARAGNLEALHAAEHNACLIPVAVVDPRILLDCRRTMRELVGQGFKCFRVFSDYQGWPLDSKVLRIVMEELDEIVPGALFLLPVNEPGEVSKIEQLASDAPALNFVVCGVNSSFRPIFAEAVALVKDSANVYLETHRFDSADAFEQFREALGGVERLVFGSFSPLYYTASSVFALARSGLERLEKESIARGNLEKLIATPSPRGINSGY